MKRKFKMYGLDKNNKNTKKLKEKTDANNS